MYAGALRPLRDLVSRLRSFTVDRTTSLVFLIEPLRHRAQMNLTFPEPLGSLARGSVNTLVSRDTIVHYAVLMHTARPLGSFLSFRLLPLLAVSARVHDPFCNGIVAR